MDAYIHSNWVDQLRYSFQQAVIAFDGGSGSGLHHRQSDGLPAQGNLLTTLEEGFGLEYSFPQGRVVKVTQVQNNATWTHGNQTILFRRRSRLPDTPTTWSVQYNGTFSLAP